MDSFTAKSTPSGVRVTTQSSRTFSVSNLFGFPAALLRAMIDVVKQTGSVILPTRKGTYVVRPVPGEDAVVGRKHVQEK